MPGSVGKGVKNDVTEGATVNDACFRVRQLGSFAENASCGLARAAHVGIAPRGPQIVHAAESSRRRRVFRVKPHTFAVNALAHAPVQFRQTEISRAGLTLFASGC